MTDTDNIVVTVQCLTFNHGRYVRDCLEGIVSQITDFKFVAYVHDDASGDETPQIIGEYALKYPDIIIPAIEEENLYRTGMLMPTVDEAISRIGARYTAICEGDDFWTDPYKLQKQVDYMESHPECTMCVAKTLWQDESGRRYLPRFVCRYNSDRDLTTEEIIRYGGQYISYTSTIYRSSLTDNLPHWMQNIDILDYTQHILGALRGKVHYFHEPMAVYRFQSAGSWTSIQKKAPDLNHFRCEINWMNDLDKETEGRYARVISIHLFRFYGHLFKAGEVSFKELLQALLKGISMLNLKLFTRDVITRLIS